MIINKKALEILCDLIVGDGTADYRGGRQLVEFFNELGFDDRYGQGFPSRRNYTIDKLTRINGSPELDKCIKMTFSVVDHVERIEELDESIKLFNKYLISTEQTQISNCRQRATISPPSASQSFSG